MSIDLGAPHCRQHLLHDLKEHSPMYRGSRLAASFLLFLTGFAVLAVGATVVPAAVRPAGAWVLIPLAIAFGMAHFVALVGLVRGWAWARDVAVSIAEAGGGVAIAAGIALAMGADLIAATSTLSAHAARAEGVGLAAWFVGLYGLLGVSAGRVRFDEWRPRYQWQPTPLRVEA
jgi:hypothetical protein